MSLPGGRHPFGGRLPGFADQHLHARLHRCRDLVGLPRLALEGGHHAIPQPADLLLDRPEELPGADEVVPAIQHLAAQQAAVRGLHRHRPRGLGVGLLGVAAQGLQGGGLIGDRLGDPRGVGDQRPDRTVKGLHHHRPAAHGVVGEFGQPAADRRDGRVRQQAFGVHLGFGDGEQRRGAQAPLAHHLAQVRGHLGHRGRRHAVEHHRHHRVAGGRRAQIVPGHGVGVTGGGGDEEPQVGGGQQLGRQRPVLGDHRVDVGGVQDGQAGRQGRLGHQLQSLGVGHPVGAAAEPRQDPVGAEPAGVAGVMDEHRRAGGRTDHARRAHHASDHRIDQGRLAGAGRAADHRQQRRLQPAEPRQDVVVELRDRLTGADGRRLAARQAERQPDPGQRIAQPAQRLRASLAHAGPLIPRRQACRFPPPHTTRKGACSQFQAGGPHFGSTAENPGAFALPPVGAGQEPPRPAGPG